MIIDSVLVRKEDGTLTKCFLHDDRLVFIHRNNLFMDGKTTSETISFSDHPEVRCVYNNGWVLSGLTALLTGENSNEYSEAR